MTVKVSLGGLNHESDQRIRREVDQLTNQSSESMEEYAKLIKLVRKSFRRQMCKSMDNTQETL